MSYYSKNDYRVTGYRKSNTKHKKYDAVLENKSTGRLTNVPFGDTRYENYHDMTKLDAYPGLIHGDEGRRRRYRARHKKDLKLNHYSPGYFSYYKLW